MSTPSRPALQKHTRAAWRRAADELLIDAIFGSSTVIRDHMPPASAAQLRAADTAMAANAQPASAI